MQSAARRGPEARSLYRGLLRELRWQQGSGPKEIYRSQLARYVRGADTIGVQSSTLKTGKIYLSMLTAIREQQQLWSRYGIGSSAEDTRKKLAKNAARVGLQLPRSEEA